MFFCYDERVKRATLLLEDSLYDRAKKLGKQRDQTLKEVINDILRLGLNQLSAKKNVKFDIIVHKNNGPQAGVNIADRNALYDLMDEI